MSASYHTGNPYKKFAEVESHEEGHKKKSNEKNKGWDHNEIWNDWYSVVYPRLLNSESPELDSRYHGEVLELGGIYYSGSNKHGAFELQKVFQELIDMAKSGKAVYRGKKLTPEDIERSAITTFVRRSDRGSISLGKIKTVGFADLYDEIKYNADKKSNANILPYNFIKEYRKSAFKERFLHCTDKMYEMIDRPKNIKKSVEEPVIDAPEIVQQIYNNLLAKQISVFDLD